MRFFVDLNTTRRKVGLLVADFLFLPLERTMSFFIVSKQCPPINQCEYFSLLSAFLLFIMATFPVGIIITNHRKKDKVNMVVCFTKVLELLQEYKIEEIKQIKIANALKQVYETY